MSDADRYIVAWSPTTGTPSVDIRSNTTSAVTGHIEAAHAILDGLADEDTAGAVWELEVIEARNALTNALTNRSEKRTP